MSTHQLLSACLLGFWFCSSVHCQQDLPAIADSHISCLYPVNKDKKVKELIIQVTWAFFTGNIAAIQINISLIYKAHDEEFWFNDVSIHEDHFRQNAVLTWFYIETAKMISQTRHKKYFVCICRPMNFLRVSRSASFFLFAKCKNSPNATIFYIQEAHWLRFAHLSDIATADMQMLCNIYPILSSQLMKISSLEQFLVLKKNIWAWQSMEHYHLNKLSITFQQKDQCEIWWKLAKWFLKNREFYTYKQHSGREIL